MSQNEVKPDVAGAGEGGGEGGGEEYLTLKVVGQVECFAVFFVFFFFFVVVILSVSVSRASSFLLPLGGRTHA